MFGRGMKIYAVYTDPDADSPHETATFVEEHASLWGFLFHVLWCFYHKLWLQAILLTLLWNIVIIKGPDFGLSIISVFAIEFFIRIAVMFEGNSWRQNQLLAKGYILADVVSGRDEVEAQQRFFERWLETSPSGETKAALS
jgi:hypothetical protein